MAAGIGYVWNAMCVRYRAAPQAPRGRGPA
jgi:hypothetical protein